MDTQFSYLLEKWHKSPIFILNHEPGNINLNLNLTISLKYIYA